MKTFPMPGGEISIHPLRRNFPLLRGIATIGPALGLLMLAPGLASAQSFTAQNILATANIYGAGRTGIAATPGPSGADGAGAGNGASNGGGTAAPVYVLNNGSNRVLTFSSVTGQVCYDLFHDAGDLNSPDGGGSQNSQVSAYQGISGLNFTTGHGQLVGVFINGAPSGYADGSSGSDASSLSFSSADQAQATYAPVLDQSFFIGDGLTGTGTGTTQQFDVPSGATELVLGFSDAQNYGGPPGAYNDNSGSITATFSISGAASAPEPGSIALLALSGLPVAGIVARRRRKRTGFQQ